MGFESKVPWEGWRVSDRVGTVGCVRRGSRGVESVEGRRLGSQLQLQLAVWSQGAQGRQIVALTLRPYCWHQDALGPEQLDGGEHRHEVTGMDMVCQRDLVEQVRYVWWSAVTLCWDSSSLMPFLPARLTLMFLLFIPSASECQGECTEQQFKCADNCCIDDSLECDGTQHCGDNSDESACGHREYSLLPTLAQVATGVKPSSAF